MEEELMEEELVEEEVMEEELIEEELIEEELIEEEASDVSQGSVMECCLGEVKRGASPTTFREESLRDLYDELERAQKEYRGGDSLNIVRIVEQILSLKPGFEISWFIGLSSYQDLS